MVVKAAIGWAGGPVGASWELELVQLSVRFEGDWRQHGWGGHVGQHLSPADGQVETGGHLGAGP